MKVNSVGFSSVNNAFREQVFLVDLLFFYPTKFLLRSVFSNEVTQPAGVPKIKLLLIFVTEQAILVRVMVSEYELVSVVQPDLSEEVRGQVIDQIKKIVEVEKGEILSVSDWGKRELAYEIKRNSHGFYTLISFRGNPKLPGILNSKLKLMEELLRYLVVKKEDRKLKNSTLKHAAPLG